MGCFYGGNQFMNYVNAVIKFGTTGEKTPAQRLGSLRKEHTNFELNMYLELPNDTKAIREAIEHHVKMMMERHYPELTHSGNDHFNFKTNKDEHKARVEFYLMEGMRFAIQYCEMFNIEYGAIIRPNYRKGGVHYKNKKGGGKKTSKNQNSSFIATLREIEREKRRAEKMAKFAAAFKQLEESE